MVLQLQAVGLPSPAEVSGEVGMGLPRGKIVYGRAFGSLSGGGEGPNRGRTVACGPTCKGGYAWGSEHLQYLSRGRVRCWGSTMSCPESFGTMDKRWDACGEEHLTAMLRQLGWVVACGTWENGVARLGCGATACGIVVKEQPSRGACRNSGLSQHALLGERRRRYDLGGWGR